MLHFITMNSGIISLIISFSALLVAVYSVLYTHHFNKRNLTIDEVYIDHDEKYPLLSFSINNMSPAPIRVCSLTFFNDASEIVKPLDYSPEATPLEIHEYSNPLRQTTVIDPHDHLEVSYFFEDSIKVTAVTVVCKERIYRLHKDRTFELNPVDVD